MPEVFWGNMAIPLVPQWLVTFRYFLSLNLVDAIIAGNIELVEEFSLVLFFNTSYILLMRQMLWCKLDWDSSWSGDTRPPLLSCTVCWLVCKTHFVTFRLLKNCWDIINIGWSHLWSTKFLLHMQIAFFTKRKVEAFEELTWVSDMNPAIFGF